jgi:hypothetical protein
MATTHESLLLGTKGLAGGLHGAVGRDPRPRLLPPRGDAPVPAGRVGAHDLGARRRMPGSALAHLTGKPWQGGSGPRRADARGIPRAR